MKYIFLIVVIQVFIAASATAEPGSPGQINPAFLFEIQKTCKGHPEDCSRGFALGDSQRTYLAFITYTQEPNACEKYWLLIDQLKNEELFRFLNRGIAVLAEDFGTPNTAYWEDVIAHLRSDSTVVRNYTYDPRFASSLKGLDMTRSTLRLLAKLSEYPGSDWHERYLKYLREGNARRPKEDQLNFPFDFREDAQRRKEEEQQLNLLSDYGLPFVAYTATITTQGGLSSEAPMVQKLLGVVDKPHWLLGRKLLHCRFDINVHYLLELAPPTFRHEIVIGLTPYCGDARVPEWQWTKREIAQSNLQGWQSHFISRITKMYEKTLSADPFLRDQRFIPKSKKSEVPNVGDQNSTCRLPVAKKE